MATEERPGTAKINAGWWGARAEDWAEVQEAMCLPVFVAALERAGLQPGASYLDAGCGAGLAAQIAAERGARVHGLDAAPNLLEIARRRVPDGEFRTGDLENLPYRDAQFDLVTGFNSFQFAGNPGAALREARRVTRPGAHVLIMIWGKPEGMEATALLGALRPLLPSPPPGTPGPFALSDEGAILAFAEAAGLKPIDLFDVDAPWRYPDLQTGLRGLRSSGVAARAIHHSNEEAVNDAHAKALEPFRQTDGSFRIHATFRCLLAGA